MSWEGKQGSPCKRHNDPMVSTSPKETAGGSFHRHGGSNWKIIASERPHASHVVPCADATRSTRRHRRRLRPNSGPGSAKLRYIDLVDKRFGTLGRPLLGVVQRSVDIVLPILPRQFVE
jgi:hypothetical protein